MSYQSIVYRSKYNSENYFLGSPNIHAPHISRNKDEIEENKLASSVDAIVISNLKVSITD